MPLKTDGAKLRELRERKLLTQAQFAELIGYHPAYVGNVERGAENAGFRFLQAATQILGCEIDDITDGAVPRRPRSDRAQVQKEAS